MTGKKMWSTVFKMSPKQVAALIFAFGVTLTVILYCQRPTERFHSKELKALLDNQSRNLVLLVGQSHKISLFSEDVVRQHYESSDYSLIWITPEGKLRHFTHSFIDRIRKCEREGLNPFDYHLPEIEALRFLIEQTPDSSISKESCQLDLLLTDAFNSYALHQYAGRVHTNSNNPDWIKHVAEINPIDSLKEVEYGKSIDSVLNAFVCPHSQYHRLEEAMQTYSNTDVFGKQCRMQISINMERWRWLPRKMPNIYAMANIAGFDLTINDHGKDTLKMKIIVGKRDKPTPLFNGRLSYLIINPWWEVPASIARKEFLPKIKEDNTFLPSNHIRIFQGKGKSMQELPIDGINWDLVTAENFPFKLRQEPGPWNALGAVKFIFPNEHDVYFHDTPQRELFSRSVRAFSHGCIRIEKPIEFAAYLLKEDTSWIRSKIDDQKELVLRISFSPDVFICYWTCWVDETGHIQFMPDIYGYDTQLGALLSASQADTHNNLLSGIVVD